MKTLRTLFIASLLPLGACAGQITASDDQPDDADAAPGTDAGPQVDAGPAGAMYNVTGTTKDYSSGDPLPDVALATEGLPDPLQTVSGLDGAFVLANVPASSAFYFRAMPAGMNYVQTTNTSVTVLDADVQQDVRVVSNAYFNRQYTTAGVPKTLGTALLVAQLQNLDGTPFEGVPLEGIALIPDGTTTPILVETYFIGATGDVDPLLLVSTAFGGGGMMMPKARVAFLNVPPGMYTISASVTPIPGGPAQTGAGGATTYADGASLGRVIHDPSADAGGTPGFTTDVYPILQRASLGGQDCASCHTLGGVAGNVLILDDGAAAVHARLVASPILVNLITPMDSMILMAPLYETPPNHPNAIWLDITDPYYQKILAWIGGGAPL